jgi:glycosyltransferase involved in cell wall biosynthesis
MKPLFSVIVPVFNRPQEIKELLNSLTIQSTKNFEVIIVEDGSTLKCEDTCAQFTSEFPINYFFKKNTGPGLSRNFGAEKAKFNWLIFFDSDCLIPEHYFNSLTVFLENNEVDLFGGPDKVHQSFTSIQKSIGFAMSSFLTTGGIRGGNKSMEKFHPRSFNMGFTKQVYIATGGFSEMRFGEDIDFSIRVKKFGFKTALIPETWVYHKRRTDFRKFFKQVYNSGAARINLHMKHPGTLKIVHLLPAGFSIYLGISIITSFVFFSLIPFLPFLAFSLAVFTESLYQFRNLEVAFLSIIASIVQLTGYGIGFITACWKRLILKKGEYKAFEKNFYS